MELARLRSHHARWRAALIDSLHEGFFLCDEAGRVIEINAAFTAILGYGPDGLPYAPRTRGGRTRTQIRRAAARAARHLPSS